MVLQAISSPDFEWVRQASEGPPVPRFGSGQAPPRREESTPPVKHRLSRSLIFEFGNSASSQRVMPKTRDQGQDLFRKDASAQQEEENAPAAKREESSPEEEDRKPAARESPRFSLSYSEDEHEPDIGVPQPAVAVLETDGIGVVQAGEAEDYLAAHHPGYHHAWNEAGFDVPPVQPAFAVPTSAARAHGQPPPYFDPSIHHPEVAAAIHHTPGAQYLQQQQQQMIAGQGDYHHGGYDYGYGYAGAATETDVPAASHAFRPPAQAKPPPPARAKRKTAKRKTTKRGKKTTKIPRIEPTDREKAEATTGRAKKALKIWYDRLNELARYKAAHGHTNVPQKDPDNPQLGIVSGDHPVHSVCASMRAFSPASGFLSFYFYVL